MGGEVLIGGSLIWLIIWSVIGIVAGTQHPAWLEKMKTTSQEGNLEKFWSILDGYKIQTTAHAHANTSACVTFMVGLAMKMDVIGFCPKFQTGLAVWMIAGLVLLSVGDRLRSIPIVAPGGILFLTGMIASFVGLFW